jgi:hypothetical protein
VVLMNNINHNQLLMIQQFKMELQIILNKQVKEQMVKEKRKYLKHYQNQNDM